MYLKKLMISIFTILLLFTTLAAQENKIGKFLGAKHTTLPSWFSNSFLDFNEDIEELKEENKTLIIYIHQDNCPYCNLFITKNLKDKETKQKIINNFAILDINMLGNRELVDIDQEELSEKQFAIKHKVQFTPTLLFFDKKGNQILRINGYINIKDLNLALDFIKNEKYKSFSFKEYLANNDNNKELISTPKLFKNSKNFMRAKDANKMAIFFESANCEECEILHNKLLKDENTLKLLKQMDLYQVDMNSNKSIVTPNRIITKIKDWTNTLDITHSPTVILFDEKGKEIIRIEAMFKNFHFQSIIDYAVSDSYKEEKEFQRYLTKRANKIRQKGIDVNIWE